MNKQQLTVCLLVAVVVAAMPAHAFAGNSDAVTFYVASPVLPDGEVMDDAELAEVEGAFLKTAAIGALGGVLAYGAGQLYDGIVHGDWSWDWADAGKAAFTGAVAGAFGKIF